MVSDLNEVGKGVFFLHFFPRVPPVSGIIPVANHIYKLAKKPQGGKWTSKLLCYFFAKATIFLYKFETKWHPKSDLVHEHKKFEKSFTKIKIKLFFPCSCKVT